MKIRILSVACVATAAALLTACTTASRNSGACEQLMRSKLAETSSDTLRVSHRGAAIRGSRVVIEGSIEHMQTASEAAASAPRVASAPKGASAPRVASAPGAASASLVASAPGEASAPLVASAPKEASAVVNVAAKPVKPKKVMTPAAAECTFNGEALAVFRWLAPAKLVAPVAPAAPVAQAASAAG
ncbi:hypothetical protein [Paraburkholderia susongensis]|uniref:Uncharacterized protein n=1 Tax=Paraburkholderia susongensis TaxID=1515439 RepID=A0A1X7ICV2_9BURK|nr:hypothetical protein [Paraburkholderia susongensis]SMG12372.1 hypothetical protein SAMN06265784_101561 [Paraburkholderia susongensis]